LRFINLWQQINYILYNYQNMSNITVESVNSIESINSITNFFSSDFTFFLLLIDLLFYK